MTEGHPDARGRVTETYRESWFPEVPPIKQLVQSDSEPMTLRGMHLHKRQWDIWRFTRGVALVRLYGSDYGWSPVLRKNRNELILADQGTVIAIPPGIAHGFYTETRCTLVYALTEEYDVSDEYGFYPFDGMEASGISPYMWPRKHYGLIVSERDLRAPRLADFQP
jgi:dTDP-4-dehydrorhamnose 3,5-epimerase